MGLIQTIVLGYFFLCLVFALYSFYKALVRIVPKIKTVFADEDKLTVDLDRWEVIHVSVVTVDLNRWEVIYLLLNHNQIS